MSEQDIGKRGLAAVLTDALWQLQTPYIRRARDKVIKDVACAA